MERISVLSIDLYYYVIIMNNILLLTDFSELSEYAKNLANKIVKGLNSQLHILSVVETPSEILVTDEGESYRVGTGRHVLEPVPALFVGAGTDLQFHDLHVHADHGLALFILYLTGQRYGKAAVRAQE